MRALILANGNTPGDDWLGLHATKADSIVCADGGARHAKRLGIIPDIILGDFDSLTESERAHFQGVPRLHLPDQESTDLEKAIQYCISKGFTHAIIAGAVGSRLDHALAALGCLRRFASAIDLTLADIDADITLISGNVRFSCTPGDTISLVPLTRSEGITTEGLRYPLKNAVLELGVREGTSNEAISDTVSITCQKGFLLLYRMR